MPELKIASIEISEIFASGSNQILATMADRTLDGMQQFGLDASSLPSLEELQYIYESGSLWNALDDVQQQMAGAGQFQHLVVGSAAGVTTTFTVGYVLWALRGGYLLASFLSSMPAWKMIDPLPVLEFFDEEETGRKNRREDEETLESMIDRSSKENSAEQPA